MLRSTQRGWMLVCIALAGCGQTRPADKTRAPAPVPAAPERAQREPVVAPVSTPLGQRLSLEASQHPEAVAEVDARLQAFAAAGVNVTRTRQVLAAGLSAHYCRTALTSTGLALALCVFDSEAAAQAGQRQSRARFDALIPGRSLLVHGALLLTLTRPASAEAQRELTLVAELFLDPHTAERAAL